ncbi:hypothetical protein SAMN05216525_12817 [Bradyrhizobium sp. Gha]|nr:hypothetical protein SAMN05216525_12817 [Bradyrhizobium sp. Gha]
MWPALEVCIPFVRAARSGAYDSYDYSIALGVHYIS